jgi:hypothetical protein
MSKIDPKDRCIRALSFHSAVALVSLLIQSNTPFIKNIKMASNNAPAWLQANTTEAPIVTPLETEIAVPSPPSKNNNGSAATTSAAEEAELPSIILFMRLANMGVAIAMITISVGTVVVCDVLLIRRIMIDVRPRYCTTRLIIFIFWISFFPTPPPEHRL